MRCQCRSWLVNLILVISVALFVMLVLAGCALRPTMPLPVWRESVVAGIRGNSAAIAVYYTLTPEEYQKRIKKFEKTGGTLGTLYLWPPGQGVVWRGLYIEGEFGVERGLVFAPVASDEPNTIAYIGGGTLVKDNHVLTVRHLFVHDEGAIRKTIWVMFADVDHPIEADIVALSKGETLCDDYGVIRLKENLDRLGTPIAEKSAQSGEDVAYVGSVSGTAFFLRFVRQTTLHKYFYRDLAQTLHLGQFADSPFICAYPGGPGDSGGGVFNARGELVGVMYCGLEIASTNFIFSNPIEMARDFLTKNGLAGLLK